MSEKERVYQMLSEMKIAYRVTNHKAVYTIDEMADADIPDFGDVCKNLFLRDEKGKRHFIVVLRNDKKADLKKLAETFGCKRLSFASPERLLKFLGLQRGEVTPLGVLNDEERAVEVVFDRDLVGKGNLGIHPNDNTATIWLSFEDLRKIISQHGNKISYADV